MTQILPRLLRWEWCVCALLAASMTGCASEAASRELSLATVEGVVTMDGSPAAGVTVKYLPRGQTRGQGSYAVTDAAGKYSCLHPSGVPGCEEGEYNVLFSRMTTRDGKPIPDGVNAADVEAKESLPARFQNPESGMNLVTVKAGANQFDFALKLK